MKTVGVAKLKASLSSYLDRVKGGQEIVVTDRGFPVAKLVPLATSEGLDAHRLRLAKAGVLKLGSGRARWRRFGPPRGPVVRPGVLEALLEDRERGR